MKADITPNSPPQVEKPGRVKKSAVVSRCVVA